MSNRNALCWIAVGGLLAGFALAATIGYALAGMEKWPTSIIGVVMGLGIIAMHWNEVEQK